MKIAELIATSDHSPWRIRSFVVTAVFAAVSAMTVSAVHENMHQRAGRQEQPGSQPSRCAWCSMASITNAMAAKPPKIHHVRRLWRVAWLLSCCASGFSKRSSRVHCGH